MKIPLILLLGADRESGDDPDVPEIATGPDPDKATVRQIGPSPAAATVRRIGPDPRKASTRPMP